ncbi:CidA/LrgA family holin-like protein [Paenibacillus aceti]|uniref:Integral membrane protein YxzK n=1 Tax=Paenibacillus aceti TaxID=1820010 RepID=A0ABQ1VSM1_9BACL|nr:CidA/LrgA family holin-like protein [Paenibacillus aceti]GGF93937.1 putative integral membrane protein YxzK [Paenibacillus aceti]
MKIIRIIVQVILLYLFYFVGDYLQKLLHLPVSGSIVGLLLLFALLLLRVIPLKWIEDGATTILAYLPLFFIPATAGIVNHMDIFSGRGLLLILILIVSSVLTMVAAAHSSHWLSSLNNKRRVGWSGKRLSEKGKEI